MIPVQVKVTDNGAPAAFSLQTIFVNVAPNTPPLLPGDYNGNGRVEQSDLDLVLLNWGRDATTPPVGWVSQPPTGIIDQQELDAVLLNWGATLASSRAAEGGASARPAARSVPRSAPWAFSPLDAAFESTELFSLKSLRGVRRLRAHSLA
jgi:hypothetical protein